MTCGELRFLILLAIMMVASRGTSEAQTADTLAIRSLRTIDVCGTETTALLTINLGEIYFADSLLSFDITLSYDTTYLRPGIALSSGTLSAQLSWMDGPLTNSAIPGEFRVFGASVLTPAKGNLPLVAVTMDAKKLLCGVQTPIGLAYAADFNPEFRRRYEVWQGDTVRFIARQQQQADLGTSFDGDTIELSGKDNVAMVPIRIVTSATTSRPLQIEVTASDVDKATIDSVVVQGVRGDVDTSGGMALLTVPGTDTIVTGTVYIRQRTADSSVSKLVCRVVPTTCMCRVPGKVDTLVVTTVNETVSSMGTESNGQAVIDDGPVVIVANGVLRRQDDHEYPVSVRIFDVYGREWASATLSPLRRELSLEELPRGPYVITVGALGRTKRMKQWN